MEATQTAASSQNDTTGKMQSIRGRRTLLIGLGTTGACVCGQILDRLTWAYDKMENVPWVRCVVLETRDTAAAPEPIQNNARYVHLKIDRDEYADLIRYPQNYEGEMGFSTWNIEGITGEGDAITDGANNIRVLGRLALLFPRNYNAVVQEIRAALASLKSLDEKEAGQQYSRVVGKPTQVELGETLNVYVAGTLCGGTSSGGFIDMGYILKNLDGYANALKTTGVFLLPSAAHNNEKHTANTYAALVELNHFSSDHVRYSQKFPDRNEPCRMLAGTRPYDSLYLLQARGEAPIEYAKLVTAAADYIHSDVIGGTASERDSKRTDISDYLLDKDAWGATQKFFTFGLGTIEFPYTKVMKACSLRLARVGFQQLAGGTTLTQAALDTQKADVALLNMDTLITRLLQRPESRIDTAISKVLEDAYGPAQHADDPIDLARAQVEAAFKGTGQSDTHSSLPINVVPLTIEENARLLNPEFRAAIVKTANNQLVTGGLQSLVAYLEFLAKTLEAAEKEGRTAQQNDAAAALLEQADDAQEHARICRTDLPLRMAWGRSSAVKRYVRECLQHSKNYYALRLRAACAPVCADMYAENLRFVQRLLKRINNPTCGLLKEVHLLIEGLQKLYDTTNIAYGARYDGTVRVINGVELFDPATTIDIEYAHSLRETAEARRMPGDLLVIEAKLAQDMLQQYREEILLSLFAEPTLMRRFDPESNRQFPNFDEHKLLSIAHPARTAFASLNSHSILERLLGREELTADLKKANDASQLLLNWQDGPRHRDAANKSYKFLFFNDKDRQAEMFRKTIEEAHVLGMRDKISFINDQHQIMILQERGAFSLGTIKELQDGFNSKWRSDYHNPAIFSFQSRKDVTEWTTWARADDEARSYSRSLFLAGIAMGVIARVSAQQYVFHYTPTRAADRGQLLLSNSLDLAAQTIKAAGKQADIEERLAAERRDSTAADIVSRIVECIQASEGKFMERERVLSVEQVEAYLLDYVQRDSQLLEKWQAKFVNVSETRLLARDAHGDVLRDEEGRPSYHCPCERNEVLGHKASDLYIDVRQGDRIVSTLKCALCNKSLAYNANVAGV